MVTFDVVNIAPPLTSALNKNLSIWLPL